MTFLIHRDASNYADGYILVDDGASADSYQSIEGQPDKYTFWKLRYAEKSVNFWVEYGNFKYKPPQGMNINKLEEIKIL